MKRKREVTVLLLSLPFFVVFLMVHPTFVHPEVLQLSMGTSTVGGIFNNIGSPVAQCINRALPEVNITTEFTEGTVENLRLMGKKKMQLAVISPQIGYFARQGTNMFKGNPVDFRVISRLLPNTNVWVVLEKSDIKKFSDLRGRKVAVGPASGGLGTIAQTQLRFNDIDYKKDIKPYFLGAGEMAEALKDGTVEAAILTAELTHMVATTHKIRVLSWSEKDLDNMVTKEPFFGKYLLPANFFKGVNYPVLTADNGIQLICNTDMDEGLVYKLTKAVLENLECVAKIYAPAEVITPQWAASELGNPFHPGAIKYFKEKGLWKK
jgi:TRAP transporter TAXI family solute receptor